jgi:hypothetical protein
LKVSASKGMPTFFSPMLRIPPTPIMIPLAPVSYDALRWPVARRSLSSFRVDTVIFWLDESRKRPRAACDTVGKNGERVIVIALSKEALVKAPAFEAAEKTTFDKVKDKASDLGHQAADKAIELKDQAAKKIDDMKKGEPTKQ